MSDEQVTFSPEEMEQLKNDPELQALFQDTGSDFPQQLDKDSLLRLFRDVLTYEKKDYNKISKSGNLKDWELGRLYLDTRHYLSIAQFAESEKLSSVAEFLQGRSNIISNTSLSRAGFLLKLIVTQRKFSGIIEPKSLETKKGLFSEKTIERGGDDE